MFKALIGDLFASRTQTLVNAVNCVGVMGKGIALEFKKAYPAMFKDYAARCARRQVRLGEPYLYRDLSGVMIVNFPTKDHWRSASRLADIERGLDYFVAHAAGMGNSQCGISGARMRERGPGLAGGRTADFLEVAPFGIRRGSLRPKRYAKERAHRRIPREFAIRRLQVIMRRMAMANNSQL